MATTEPFSTFYAVSHNEHRFWSLEPGRRCGYEPSDDASDFLEPGTRPDPADPQGGYFAGRQFTLDHM